jgi:hypothetical protein
MADTVTKAVDGRGRLNLGARFAGRHVIVREDGPTRVLIELAVVLPQREEWLWKNTEALDSVTKGIEQAAKGQFTQSAPDLEADQALADDLED